MAEHQLIVFDVTGQVMTSVIRRDAPWSLGIFCREDKSRRADRDRLILSDPSLIGRLNHIFLWMFILFNALLKNY